MRISKCICGTDKLEDSELCEYCIAGLNCLRFKDMASEEDRKLAEEHVKRGKGRYFVNLFLKMNKK
jgi:hypothetical protein